MLHRTRPLKLAATFGASLWLGISGIALAVVSAPSPEAQVTVIEATLVPDSFLFRVDQPVANCAAGTWLKWDGKLAAAQSGSNESSEPSTALRRTNVRFMAQSVLAAKLAGSKVKVFAANASASTANLCVVENIYFP
jgi:hypothetical protein